MADRPQAMNCQPLRQSCSKFKTDLSDLFDDDEDDEEDDRTLPPLPPLRLFSAEERNRRKREAEEYKKKYDVDQQTDVVVAESEDVGEDLYTNSSECPSMPTHQSDTPPCLSSGWGSLLPPAIHQKLKKASVQWRPWAEEKQTEIGKDLNKNSSECPTPPVFASTSPPLTTPKPPHSSKFSITKTVCPPPIVIRRAKKRRRSPGDLAKRRQRKFDYLSSQRTPHTPHTEPEKSRLELGERDSGPWTRRLDWSTAEISGEENDGSNLRGSEARTDYLGLSPGSWGGSGRFLSTASTNLHGLSPPQSYQMSPPSTSCPPATPPWQASSWAPPSSAFCQGCYQWCNLVEVSIRSL